jgi:tRNA nucleotidyltransferase (CCA-adding enzyme)
MATSQDPPLLLKQAAVPSPVREVLERLEAGGFEAFLVGGCVRDLLLGKRPKDFDVATRALPADVQRLFPKVIPTGIAHGTVTVLSHGEPVEVTTYRFEGDYVDGRRPSRVEFHHDIEEDLARRDFTINAMAYSPVTQVLKDPFEGQIDLAARRVRCVGVAAERFGEDGLRPLRAVRIATVLGFELEPETQSAIRPALAVFAKVALERVHDELVKLLLSHNVEWGLGLLRQVGLFPAFFPEVSAGDAPGRYAAVGRAPADEVTRLAVLCQDVPEVAQALARLKFPTKVGESVARLCAHRLPESPEVTDGALRRWMAALGADLVPRALEVAGASGQPHAEVLATRVRALLAAAPPLTAKQLALNGKELMSILGVGPSPVVGEASRFLLEQVLESPALNTREGLTGLLQGWAKSRPA